MFGPKNNQGGFALLNLKNKVVKQHETPSQHCNIRIFDKYLKVLPSQSRNGVDDVFYLKPLKDVPGEQWFVMYRLAKIS